MFALPSYTVITFSSKFCTAFRLKCHTSPSRPSPKKISHNQQGDLNLIYVCDRRGPLSSHSIKLAVLFLMDTSTFALHFFALDDNVINFMKILDQIKISIRRNNIIETSCPML